MPPANHRRSANANSTRAQLVERNLKGCEPCKRRKRACNGQKPSAHCTDASQECAYSVVSDNPRSVFSTNTARRLSSGSACETCRRRKTKCDGQSPCGFCATNNIECVNNSERRKRVTSPSSLSTSTTANDSKTMGRIEDRLRTIEKLVTAFSPTTPQDSPRTTAFRKLSSPLLHQKSPVTAPRQQRHSIHTVSTSNEKVYISPPNDQGNNQPFADTKIDAASPPLSPPHSANMVATSMLNSPLSRSSSSTSSSSYVQYNEQQQWASPVLKEWRSSPIPSLVDQLSKCTFLTTAVDFTTVQYPIYPITSPSSSKPTNSSSSE